MYGTKSFVLRNERELQVSCKKEVTKTLRLQKCEISVQFTAVHNGSVCDLWRSECDKKNERGYRCRMVAQELYPAGERKMNDNINVDVSVTEIGGTRL